jgi:DNA polymerase-1
MVWNLKNHWWTFKMKLIFDMETDGLPPNITKIWCLVAKDIDTKQQYVYGPNQIEESLDLLARASYLAGHNILGFDLPVIESLTGRKLDNGERKIVDTLVLSRLFNPVRNEGRHSLEVWGGVLGYPKIDFEKYDAYSPEMLEYCIRDVDLNLKVYEALKVESAGFSKQSVDLEHNVYKIIAAQREKGFLFDARAATLLNAELQEKMRAAEIEVHKVFKPKVSEVKLYAQFTQTGALAKTAKTIDDVGVRLTEEEHQQLSAKVAVSDARPISRYMVTEFNLGSRQQIGDYLQDFGWKPTKLTPHGRPQVDETVLLGIKGIPEAELIAEYILLQKRVAMISGEKHGWLKYVRGDGRVHGGVRSNGTITGRMTHQSPNMAQVPNLGSLYGKECRECWITPTGYKLVGVDASQLELRMLAHYMKDEEYINEIVNGDIHTANQKLAGLESRDTAKTFIYALLYGAGDRKLGSVVGGSASSGKELRRHFFDNLPAFRTLRDKVTRAAGRGFLKGLDGRKIFVRSEHAALNTLLQSAGALVMKQALVLYDQGLSCGGVNLDAAFVANVHDEWQLEVHESCAKEVGKLGVECIRKAGEVFELVCPLDGEYKIGANWSETH